MGGDVGALAAEMTPYISAAVGAYGGAVLTKARDEAADATVSLGRRLLQKVFGHRDEAAPLPESLADLAEDPAAEVRSMLASTGTSQQVHAGRDAYTAGRDQVVVNYRRPGE